MVGCFIVQVFDKDETRAMEADVINEPSLDSLVIWDVEVEQYGNKESLIEEICSITAMEVKEMECNESCEELSEECPHMM